MILYGIKQLACKVGLDHFALLKILKRYSDFPFEKLEGVNLYVFDLEECLRWLKEHHHPIIYKEQLKSKEMLLLGDLAKELNISNQLASIWAQKHGMPYRKSVVSKHVMVNVAEVSGMVVV